MCLEAETEVVKRLLRFLADRPVDWLRLRDHETDILQVRSDLLNNIRDLHIFSLNHDMPTLIEASTKAFKDIVAISASASTEELVSIGLYVYSYGSAPDDAVLAFINTLTAERMVEIMEDSGLWELVQKNQDYFKTVICLMTGCPKCTKGEDHHNYNWR